MRTIPPRNIFYSYDIAESNTFVLQEKADQGRVNYHWLKCSSVRDITVTGLTQQTLDNTSLPSIPVSSMEEQDRKASETFASTRDMIGVGVSQEAQDIFDSLSKTMPCSWDGNVIRCYRVRISSPYSPDNCEGPDENELTRVKKVLEGEKTKLDKKRNQAK